MKVDFRHLAFHRSDWNLVGRYFLLLKSTRAFTGAIDQRSTSMVSSEQNQRLVQNLAGNQDCSMRMNPMNNFFGTIKVHMTQNIVNPGFRNIPDMESVYRMGWAYARSASDV